MKLKTAFLVLTATLGTAAVAEPARSLSFTSTVDTPNGFLPDSTVVTFDSPLPPGVTRTGGAIFSDNVPNVTARPFGATGNFFSVGPSTATAAEGRGPATVNLGVLANYFGLYWGSVDTYNTIQFLRGSDVIRTVAGAEVIAIADGDQTAIGSTYVNFFADSPDQYFDTVQFSSGGFAFESDNLAFRPVPTPALLPAAIGFGAAMLRKRKKSEQGEAETNA